MKILFLDIDGVLNHSLMESNDEIHNYLLSKNCLSNLQKVVAATDCKIVITSTWRRDASLYTRLDEILKGYGLGIYDKTKFMPHKLDNQVEGIERTNEIMLWLHDNHGKDISHFVVIDDDTILLPDCYLVQTGMLSYGLNSEKTEETIHKMMSNPTKPS